MMMRTAISIPSDTTTGSVNGRPLRPNQLRWLVRQGQPRTEKPKRESAAVRRFQAWVDLNRDALMPVLPEI